MKAESGWTGPSLALPLPNGTGANDTARAEANEAVLGVFMFMIRGYITPTILETVAPALPPSRRYSMIAAVSVLIPVLAYLIAGLGDGTYEGSAGMIFAFIGVGAVYTFTVGLGTRPSQVLLGPAGILASLAISGWQGVAGYILGLLAWTAAIAALLLLPASRRLERRRDPAAAAASAMSATAPRPATDP